MRVGNPCRISRQQPQDSFTGVEQKSERYAASGVPFILVFDPTDRKVWTWNRELISLVRVKDQNLAIGGATVDLETVWRRFDTER